MKAMYYWNFKDTRERLVLKRINTMSLALKDIPSISQTMTINKIH